MSHEFDNTSLNLTNCISTLSSCNCISNVALFLKKRIVVLRKKRLYRFLPVYVSMFQTTYGVSYIHPGIVYLVPMERKWKWKKTIPTILKIAQKSTYGVLEIMRRNVDVYNAYIFVFFYFIILVGTINKILYLLHP